MADIAHLDRLLAWAEEEERKRLAGQPSAWDQSGWITWDKDLLAKLGVSRPYNCGTVCCIAGKVALESGAAPYIERYEHGAEVNSFLVVLPGGKVDDVQDLAQNILELNDDQAEDLFEGNNTIEDLRDTIADIKEAEGTPE